MRGQPTKIVLAVEAELRVLEQRVRKLRELKRLALELDEDRLFGAVTAPPDATKAKSRRTQSAPLSATDAVGVARELLADGPTTVGKILNKLGRSPTRRATAAVQEALEQLGAKVTGRARGCANLYALADKPVERSRQDAGELLERIAELARSAVGWSDQEFQYQLRKRCGIDASLNDIRAARLQLNHDKRAAV